MKNENIYFKKGGASEYDLRDCLFDHYPFIFPVGNDHYLMGSCVCRKCNDEEIVLFNEFVFECQRVNEIHDKKERESSGKLTKEELEPLANIMCKISSLSEEEFNDETLNKSYGEIWEIIISLSYKEQQELFEKILFVNRAFGWKIQYEINVLMERLNEK